MFCFLLDCEMVISMKIVFRSFLAIESFKNIAKMYILSS